VTPGSGEEAAQNRMLSWVTLWMILHTQAEVQLVHAHSFLKFWVDSFVMLIVRIFTNMTIRDILNWWMLWKSIKLPQIFYQVFFFRSHPKSPEKGCGLRSDELLPTKTEASWLKCNLPATLSEFVRIVNRGVARGDIL